MNTNHQPEDQKVIVTVKKSLPAVVSIIISKNVPRVEGKNFFGNYDSIKKPWTQKPGIKKTLVGGGSGFIISPDGMILTNRHVVIDKNAEYTVTTSQNTRHSARVLAKDPINDIAPAATRSRNFKTPFPKVLFPVFRASWSPTRLTKKARTICADSFKRTPPSTSATRAGRCLI